MLGQSALVQASSAPSANRVFVYEVEGMRQNDQTDNNNYPVRSSSTITVQVPYKRMNDEMQRISRMGGKIVAIHSLESYTAKAASDATEK